MPVAGSQRVHVRFNQIYKKSTFHITNDKLTFPIRSPLENGWYGMSLKAVGTLQGPQPSGLSWISGETKCAFPSILTSRFLIRYQADSLTPHRDWMKKTEYYSTGIPVAMEDDETVLSDVHVFAPFLKDECSDVGELC